MKFEEERAFRQSRELEQGEQQVPAPQVVSHVPSMQQSGHQFPKLLDHTVSAQVHQFQWFKQQVLRGQVLGLRL